MKRPRFSSRAVFGLLTAGLLTTFPVETLAAWQAGTASVVITPKQPMWMSGYASRTRPSEGAVHDLWAKALAI